MGVISDMILAVAVVTLAPGAIPELQIRMAHIRPAADGAAVIVIGVHFDLVRANLFRFDLKLHHIGSACGSGLGGLAPSAEFASPGLRQQIDNILSEEEEVVQQGHGGGQIQRIGIFQ